MSDAVFSSAYAAELVQRAKDGATFSEVTRDSWARVKDEEVGAWLPLAWYVRNHCRQFPGTHWRHWCRELAAHVCLAHELAGEAAEWSEAWRLLDRMQDDFRDTLDILGSLYQLPDRWSDECREIARGM